MSLGPVRGTNQSNRGLSSRSVSRTELVKLTRKGWNSTHETAAPMDTVSVVLVTEPAINMFHIDSINLRVQQLLVLYQSTSCS